MPLGIEEIPGVFLVRHNLYLKKVSQEFEWKFIIAFSHNGDENKPFKNIQLGNTPPLNTVKQFFEGERLVEWLPGGGDNSDKWISGVEMQLC